MSTIDPKLLREYADRAYNYRWKTGKQEFRALYVVIEILEYAEKHSIDVSTPQLFQNLLTKLRDAQEKLDAEASGRFRSQHMKHSKKHDFRGGLSKSDWHDYIFAEGENVCRL